MWNIYIFYPDNLKDCGKQNQSVLMLMRVTRKSFFISPQLEINVVHVVVFINVWIPYVSLIFIRPLKLNVNRDFPIHHDFFKYRLSDFMSSFNFVYLQNVREFNEVIDRYD